MVKINPYHLFRLIILAFLFGTFLVSCQANTITREPIVHPAVSEIVVDDSKITFVSAVWAPGGDLIAAEGFEGCLRCPTSIYLLTPKDGQIRKFSEGYGQSSPTWVGNSNVLGFTWSTDIPGIYTTDISSYEPTFFHNGFLAAWSPDGKSVAFVERSFDKETAEISSELAVMDMDRRDEKIVFQTPWSLEARIQGVTWSPDGNELAFATTWFQGNVDEDHLYVMKADGTLLYTLVENLDRVRYPVWMLDRNWLIFVYGKEQRLAFINVSQNCVVRTEITGVEYPSLSPDGKSLLYTAGKIYRVDLTILLGSNIEALECTKQ